MADKILLVDGNSLMHRAFYALPIMNNDQGVYTNAVYGFLSMLFSAIRQENPAYLGVAFDLSGPTFRHLKYEAYKAGRAAMPDELRPQFDLIKRLLGDMRVAILSREGYEADDMLGTYSRMAGERGLYSLLLTGDRDAFQLAGPDACVLYTRRGTSDMQRVDTEYIKEKYGVEPERMVDIKALMGDSSDNIPGVPGVGEKTAVRLIGQYGTLERVLECAAEQKGKLRERLETFAGQARFSKWLGTIERHAPVEWDEDALRLGDLSGGRPLMEQLQLRALLSRLDALGGAPRAEEQSARKIEFSAPCQLEDARALADWLGEDAGRAQWAVCAQDGRLSLACEDGRTAALNLDGDLIRPGVDISEALRAAAPLIEGGAPKFYYNVKRMDALARQAGIRLGGRADDVMLSAYVLDPQRKSYALSALVQDEDLTPAAAVLRLGLAQRAQMERDGLTRLYEDVELKLAYTLGEMERAGFLVDEGELRRLGALYEQEIAKLTRSIYERAGEQFNINSPKQLGALLFEKLGLPGGKKTKTGYATGAEVLESLSGEHPIVSEILEYRKYAKLKSTYVDALLRLRGADGRIHTSFDQTATATGRISSQEPNLQNIPVRTELGREIRRAFIARPGSVLVDADYSQIELRVLAHMSGDETMRDAFLHDQDIHRRTAAEVYGVPLEEVSAQMRSAAKAVNFGIVYGISDFGLARNIGVSRAQAAGFIKRYLDRYPGIRRFMDEAVARGKTDGYVTTLMGRRRYLRELSSDNYNIRSFGERAAMNSPIQGSAADIIKLAMVRVREALRAQGFQARLILQVHDELIVEAPQSEAGPVSELLRREMENVVRLDVPLKVDVSTGRDWDACK